MSEPTPKSQYQSSAAASLETLRRLGGELRPISISRVMARKIAFELINAKQADVDALIDAIIDAAKAEIKAER